MQGEIIKLKKTGFFLVLNSWTPLFNKNGAAGILDLGSGWWPVSRSSCFTPPPCTRWTL